MKNPPRVRIDSVAGTAVKFDKAIVLTVEPPPQLLLDIFPDRSSKAAYAQLQSILSSPAASLSLSLPIRLPGSIFDQTSELPGLTGRVMSINFKSAEVVIRLHPKTKHALSRAYDGFLQSTPNEYIPPHIKETWRARFWRRMDSTEWRVSTKMLALIDTKSGSCDFLQYRSRRKGFRSLPLDVRDMLKVVVPTVQELFTPTLNEARNIWEIPYRVDEHNKTQFLYREPRKIMIETLRRTGPKPFPIPGLGANKRKRDSADNPDHPTHVRIANNVTGGKTAIRLPLLKTVAPPVSDTKDSPPMLRGPSHHYPTPPADPGLLQLQPNIPKKDIPRLETPVELSSPPLTQKD